MDYTHRYASPLGGITLASDGEALVGLWFDGQRHFGETLDAAHAERPLPVFDAADRWLDSYFRGGAPGLPPRLKPRGTPFRRAVWALLQAIPYGETATYGEIAARLAGQTGLPPASARAVGGAVAHNPISLMIPCHRVVGKNGSLTGYAGGTDKKLRLLRLEGADAGDLRAPEPEGLFPRGD